MNYVKIKKICKVRDLNPRVLSTNDLKSLPLDRSGKLATIENGFLVAKADGIVEVTGQSGELKNTWKLAVGKSKLPKEGDAAPDDDDDDFLLGLIMLGLPLALVGGGAWWWFAGRKKA